MWVENEASKKLTQMTKKELIEAMRQSFRIFIAYIGLRNRYDNLKAAIDILRNQNTGVLQAVKEIDRLYEKTQSQENSKSNREWKQYTDALPKEAWIC